ncbi:MAG: ABC transporter permease [Bifidobacteriaceae bacterium]|jgi:ABC-2 type transport system permease protein|nr:ABC transporter permease [Bifidobacteriaceae bacterium]
MSGQWLVAQREIVDQVRSKAFLISSLVMVVLAFGGSLVGGLAATGRLGGGEGERDRIMLVGELAEAAALVPLSEQFELGEAETQEDAENAIRAGSALAALVPDPEEPLGLVVIADEEAPSGLINALTVTPRVKLLQPEAVNWLVARLAGMGFAVVFFMMVLMYGQIAAQKTVVEKQTRVIELLLATVRARALLAGKILGNSALAFGTLVALTLAGVLGLLAGGGAGLVVSDAANQLAAAAGRETLLEVLGPPLGWFLMFFLVAFVMYSALMVGSAATVSRLEDVGNVLTPVTLLIMVPYFMVVMFPDNKTMLEWLSFIPFSAPTAMPIRLVGGDVPAWQVGVALLALVVTTYLAILAGGRIYEGSILRTGARVKLADAVRERRKATR